jgi:hypothetical protein
MNEFNSLLEELDLKEFSDQFEGSKMATLKESSSVLAQRKSLFNINEVGGDLLVPIGETVVIGVDMNQYVKPETISTNSVDEYKLWIGRSNKKADNHPWEMPSKLWSKKEINAKTNLTQTEISDIKKAGWIYLFNDASKVADYKEAIEQYQESFEASLYHFRRIIIQPGGRLILKGDPALVLIDELEIQGNGQFEAYTICHTTIGSLRKIEQKEFINN